MKGLTLDNLERYQESLKCYNLAIRANPNLIQAYHNKGNTLYNLENFKDAVECYHQVIQLCPKKRDTYNNLDKCYSNLGNTLSKLKKYSDAIIAFDTAYELNQDPFYLRNKGDTLLILGRKAEAKQCYQDAIQQGYQNVQYVREKLRVLQ